MLAFTFLPEMLSHSAFTASTTTDLCVLKGGTLLSKSTLAIGIRIITLPSLFHSQAQHEMTLCLSGLVPVGEQIPKHGTIAVPGLSPQAPADLAF